jgi:hypothetical protein
MLRFAPRRFLSALFIWVAVIPAAAQDTAPGVRFSGEAYTDAAVTVSDNETFYGGLTSLRLDLTAGDRQTFKVEGSGIVRLLYGNQTQTVSDGTGGSVTLFDLKKLYLSVYADWFDLSAGRMIVNYGRGTIFSPVDLFAGVDTADLALGRTGTDAARLLIPLGMVSGLDLVATLPYGAGEMTGGLRGYTSLAGWEFGLSLFRDGSPVRTGDEGTAGLLVCSLDFQGDLLLGLCGEGVVRIPWDDGGLSGSGVTASFMAGLDWSAGGEWFFDLEYLANLGEGSATGTFRGDHNLYGSVAFKPDLLTSISLQVIVRIDGPAWQGMFTVARSIADQATLLGYMTYTYGDLLDLTAGEIPAALTGGVRVSVYF